MRDYDPGTILPELPAGYRWATEEETEEAGHSGDFSGMVQVRTGGTDDEPETDLAVPRYLIARG